jgi:D-galactose 1-dehydrogenase/L-arabinose 1- dehydrogenase
MMRWLSNAPVLCKEGCDGYGPVTRHLQGIVMISPIRLGIVGIGKIARDQHLPAIAADPRFELIAVADPVAEVEGVASYPGLAAMLAAEPGLDAVSFCTPPAARYAVALEAIRAGKHVMLEKPPAATVTQATHLVEAAAARGVALFATWHSREAAAVEAAATRLSATRIDGVRIDWLEDVRRWHPGQEWIFAAGGFGVFDPGINALSILTAILPDPVTLAAAHLTVPANRQAPIAARLGLRSGDADIAATFDFRQQGSECWTIAIDTADGRYELSDGGARLALEGVPVSDAATNREYARLYDHFAALIAGGASDADLAPIRIVADAFLVGEVETTDAFHF